MEIPNKLLKVAVLVLLGAVVAMVLFGAAKRSSYEGRLVELQNAVASRDQTIEVQKGVYQKLALQSRDLEKLLAQDNEQLKLLREELKKGKEQLLTATSATLRWKKAYEASVAGNQTDIPTPNGLRKKVEFEKDFGYIGVRGHTLTDPPEAFVKVEQNRPLGLSLVVSQDRAGAWKTRVTSSEENVAVDVTLSAVNPWLLEQRWYERIGVSVDLGVGSGFLGGVGASYEVSKFELGPKAWFTASQLGVQTFYGAGLTWHPFRR